MSAATGRPSEREGGPTTLLCALALGAFAIGTSECSTMSLLPSMAAGLRIDEPTAGHLVSAYALGVVVGAPALATVCARMRRRPLLVALMLLFAVGNALSAIAPGYWSMLAFRLLSGLPHGAYLGIASLAAAHAVEPRRRAAAVGRVMLGLTVATVIGVPLADRLGQVVGWRCDFAAVAALALATAALVGLLGQDTPVPDVASPLRELGALRLPQVWLTLGTGAIGFGGLFAVYAYLQSTLTNVTGMAPGATGIVFAALGVGMTVGNLVVPPHADRAMMPTAAAMLSLSAIALALFPLAARSVPGVLADVVAICFATSLATVLQTRLMDVAGDAQALASALNPAAFNVANAIGPLVGGLAISAGWGWGSTGYAGSGLAAMGLIVWGLAARDARRRDGRRRGGAAGP